MTISEIFVMSRFSVLIVLLICFIANPCFAQFECDSTTNFTTACCQRYGLSVACCGTSPAHADGTCPIAGQFYCLAAGRMCCACFGGPIFSNGSAAPGNYNCFGCSTSERCSKTQGDNQLLPYVCEAGAASTGPSASMVTVGLLAAWLVAAAARA
eukprot:TRINITY_DN10399_c0_g1_i2.p2 TRINITY_DN10399_c0_g1~~TRINITY_DN10399_c0_g1_i2.p2  ORF type:complete len:155 (-),score=9.31 TRINITY_DN10399_c0_g1_i2:438-902(-)